MKHLLTFFAAFILSLGLAQTCTPTPAQTEGPYFTPNSPRTTNLLTANTPGTRLVISGRVLDQNCQPVAGALIDFWQADSNGVYDNRGYTLRGHQLTDAQGNYRLETVVPGEYPGRTEHIHVKVHLPNNPRPQAAATLTTQLYFPGQTSNNRDGIFRPQLVLKVVDGSSPLQASFDFVLRR